MTEYVKPATGRGTANRELTKEQFSDGTTIDGDRLQVAVDDMVDTINEVPKRYIGTRFTPTTRVFGWQPAVSGADNLANHNWPWMRIRNKGPQLLPDKPDGESDLIYNPYRWKGTAIPNINDEGSGSLTSTHGQAVWENSWQSSKPSILDTVCLVMATDNMSEWFNDDGAAGVRLLGFVDLPSVDHTFAGWFKSSGSTNQSLFQLNDGIDTDDQLYVYKNSNKTLGVTVKQGGVTKMNANSTDVVVDDEYFHLAWVYNDTSFLGKLYLNGKEVISSTVTSGHIGLEYATIFVGGDLSDSNPLTGSIREFGHNPTQGLSAAAVRELALGQRDMSGDNAVYDTYSTTWTADGNLWLMWQDEDRTSVVTDQMGNANLAFDSADYTTNVRRYGEYANTFKYGSSAPTGKSQGDWVDDIVLEVTVDSPFDPEDRQDTAVIFNKYRFSAQSHMLWKTFSDVVLPAKTGVDMEPAHPGNALNGLAIDINGLNIPIPAGARVRTGVILPLWDTGSVYAGWNTNPYVSSSATYSNEFSLVNQAYSMTVVTLEEIEE